MNELKRASSTCTYISCSLPHTLSACRAAGLATSNRAVTQALEGATALDIVRARARHAAWLQGVRPAFLTPEAASKEGCVQITDARHPLLLQPSLPPLPRQAPRCVSGLRCSLHMDLRAASLQACLCSTCCSLSLTDCIQIQLQANICAQGALSSCDQPSLFCHPAS